MLHAMAKSMGLSVEELETFLDAFLDGRTVINLDGSAGRIFTVPEPLKAKIEAVLDQRGQSEREWLDEALKRGRH